jgi:hypothetical protein
MLQNKSDDQKSKTMGSKAQAKEWIEQSSLSPETKRNLLKFISRFPSLNFYRENANVLTEIEKTQEVKFPPWFRSIRQILSSISSEEKAFVQFDSFDHWTPREDLLQKGELWYSLSFRGFTDKDEQNILDQVDGMLPYPMGDDEARYSTLAIDLSNPKDTAVYEYNLEDLQDNLAEEFELKESIRKVFDTYVGMLGHIKSVKFITKGKTSVIQATT